MRKSRKNMIYLFISAIAALVFAGLMRHLYGMETLVAYNFVITWILTTGVLLAALKLEPIKDRLCRTLGRSRLPTPCGNH